MQEEKKEKKLEDNEDVKKIKEFGHSLKIVNCKLKIR